MKITTWNVNSLTARLQHVLDWLATNPVDVLCLQELKLTDDKFPLLELQAAGYPHCAVFGQKTYNGVAILSRTELRDVVKNITHFPDEHSRVITASVDAPGGELRVVNGYFVNGQAPGTEACDPGVVGGFTATCDSDCTANVCGDGLVNFAAGELCDPGTPGGFTMTCDSDCTPRFCGDGVRNAVAGEACDTGGMSATCDADCSAVTCGDGYVNPLANEQCDDGNAAEGRHRRDRCDRRVRVRRG